MHLYHCNNKPRPRAGMPILVQDGWIVSRVGVAMFTRIPRMIEIPFINSVDCVSDRSHFDTGCTGCRHANKVAGTDAAGP